MNKQILIPCTNYYLQADWHEGVSTDKVVLTFAGFGSSKKSNHDFIEKIVKTTGISALVIDLSGHGESPFKIDEITPAQHLLEAIKAFDWTKANNPSSNIYVMGTSYGGFIAAYLTRFRITEKLILRTPAIYKPSMLYTAHRNIDKILVREYRRDSNAVKRHPLFLQPALGSVSTLLIVHGNDESVPTQTTDVYSDVFSAKSYIADGFSHAFRDPSNPQEHLGRYYDIIAKHLLS